MHNSLDTTLYNLPPTNYITDENILAQQSYRCLSLAALFVLNESKPLLAKLPCISSLHFDIDSCKSN